VADEPMRTPQVQTRPNREQSDRGMVGPVGAFLVLVVVLVLLMARGCEPATGHSSLSRDGKEIVPVEGLTAHPGVVSVWVADSGDISATMHVAGLENSTVTDMGGGRYVISVPPGTEDTVVRMLETSRGVHDAGLVYDLKR